MVTFYELMYMVTRPVNFDYNLDPEDRTKLNRRKLIRNRLHLWLFLTRNRNVIRYRAHHLRELSIDGSQDLEESGEERKTQGE